jgi:hypothetical protein
MVAIPPDCRIENLSFYVCAIAFPDTTKHHYFGGQNSLKKMFHRGMKLTKIKYTISGS